MSPSNTILKVQDLTKHFGAVVAVDGVNFNINEGTFKSLIGPNGAGKTTLFNCICGIHSISDGSVFLHGEDITTASPNKIARRGLSRSYQVSNLFNEFTVFENVRLAVQANISSNFDFWSHYSTLEEPKERAHEILERVGIAKERDSKVSSLSHGKKRLLEVGLTLASDPDIILLDEPTAGLGAENIDMVVDLIDRIGSKHTILLVEHNMDVVMQLSDQIMVLDRGRLIIDDAPKIVREDERVREAYLGTEQSIFEGVF